MKIIIKVTTVIMSKTCKNIDAVSICFVVLIWSFKIFYFKTSHFILVFMWVFKLCLRSEFCKIKNIILNCCRINIIIYYEIGFRYEPMAMTLNQSTAGTSRFYHLSFPTEIWNIDGKTTEFSSQYTLANVTWLIMVMISSGIILLFCLWGYTIISCTILIDS